MVNRTGTHRRLQGSARSSSLSRGLRNTARMGAALLLGASVAAMLAGEALADTPSWQGGSDTNWSTAGNWSTGNVPVDGDDVTIAQTGANAPSNYDVTFVAHSLTLQTAGAGTNSLTSGYVVNPASGHTLGLASGGFITDNAANGAADQLNMGVTLNGPATITLGSGATGLVMGGVIAGTGPLTVTDNSATGNIVFTADNTYSGGTTISAGTLQLGNGGTAGSITGDVTDNGTLAVDRSDTYTFAGAISGSGSVSQIGAGTTILTGTNTYSGGTTVSSGILQVGDGSTTGSIVGNVADNASLVFDRSDAYAFNGSITGTGSVVQAGAGTLTLGGTSLYSGGTTVQSGTLAVSADANLGIGHGHGRDRRRRHAGADPGLLEQPRRLADRRHGDHPDGWFRQRGLHLQRLISARAAWSKPAAAFSR